MKEFCNAAFLALLCAVFLPPRIADAYKPVGQPLSVAVVQAEAIVVAWIKSVPERPLNAGARTAEIEITNVLKGTLPGGKTTVLLNQDHSLALGPLKTDQQYILFLRPTRKQPARQEVMLVGTRPNQAEEEAVIKSTVAVTPAWSEPQNGLSVVLAAGKYRIKPAEELHLSVICRNVSDRQITLKYTDWPLNTHTFCELEVVQEGRSSVAALPHPQLTPEKINAHFSKFPHSYSVVLDPLQDSVLHLGPINTAEPGYGFKEKLDFKYYPMTKPGRYEVTAKLRNYLHGTELVAKGSYDLD